GFLQEANATHAQIMDSYEQFRDEPQLAVAQLLKQQLNLLEGAARLGDQDPVADVSHTLSVAFSKYADGLFDVDDGLLSAMESCLQFNQQTLTALVAGTDIEDPAIVLENFQEMLDARIAAHQHSSRKASE